MLKEAKEPEPSEMRHFKTRPDELTQRDLEAFYFWWDSLIEDEVVKAVDAVWGKG